MNLKNAALLILFLSLVLFTACGGASTPVDQMKAADDAMAAEDYEEAFDLYQGLVNWNGEGEVARDKRFKAALESIKCEIQLGKHEGAQKNFVTLENDFAEEMGATSAYKYSLDIVGNMVAAKVPVEITVEVILYAREKYPDVGEKLDQFKEDLIKQADTPSAKAALKKLGYL